MAHIFNLYDSCSYFMSQWINFSIQTTTVMVDTIVVIVTQTADGENADGENNLLMKEIEMSVVCRVCVMCDLLHHKQKCVLL